MPDVRSYKPNVNVQLAALITPLDQDEDEEQEEEDDGGADEEEVRVSRSGSPQRIAGEALTPKP